MVYIYANIGGILMVNVTIYSIHGSYGYNDMISNDLRHIRGWNCRNRTSGEALGLAPAGSTGAVAFQPAFHCSCCLKRSF